MSGKRKSAAILAIGDELLSGRTRDSNIHYLAKWLTERGVALDEARLIGDDEDTIVDALNALRARYDYVFTSGGIGPTHDDITVDAIAKAFGVAVVEHPDAVARIHSYYESINTPVTPARLRMARTPDGAELIENPISGAPGVKIDNVFVMAGVPRIFETMLRAIDTIIERGPVMHSTSLIAQKLPESKLADPLRDIQDKHRDVAIGSYPIDGDIKGVTVVMRSQDGDAIKRAAVDVAEIIHGFGVEPVSGDHKD